MARVRKAQPVYNGEASLYDVIRKPLVTEKSTLVGEYNKYVFAVATDATKIDVKKAVEFVFNVKVASVNILNQVGKEKRFRGRLGRTNGFKKSYVTLEEGHSIDLGAGA